MKIVNICLSGSYNIGWGYQDNLISKYQKANGNEVTLITTRFINDKNSEDYLEVEPGVYYDGGVKVIRLEHGLGKKLTKLFRHYKGLYATLEGEHPDLVFIHGLQFIDILYVCKYLNKNKNVKCCVDNHADKTNSAKGFLANFVHKTIWKFCAQQINKYVEIFYGVLPVRCDFLHIMYDIDYNKIQLLVMGADDEFLNKGINSRAETRKMLNINDDDFMILTGGKIDYHKTETLDLMDAVNDIKNRKVKLVVFGSVADRMKETFESKLSGNVIYVGWANQEEIYKLIGASDLGFYPGRHSVIWEQMVASGTPCVFKNLPKTNHVDIGGNCVLLDDASYEGIMLVLNNVLNEDAYKVMKKAAMSKKRNEFLYSKIAKKPIDRLF